MVIAAPSLTRALRFVTRRVRSERHDPGPDCLAYLRKPLVVDRLSHQAKNVLRLTGAVPAFLADIAMGKWEQGRAPNQDRRQNRAGGSELNTENPAKRRTCAERSMRKALATTVLSLLSNIVVE
jgi:hypothetical protein